MSEDRLTNILALRASQPDDGQVYIEGAWVKRTPTVPTDGGAQMVVDFAERAWRRNMHLQLEAFKADRCMAQAETALKNLIETGLDKDVAIALAAVQKAREHL